MKHLLALVSLCALACAPEPVYDETIGLEAIPVEVGALEGSFALKSLSVTVEETPVLGEQEGGGVNLLLVQRTWDPEEGVYRQESQLCGGENFEVAGLAQSIPVATYQSVQRSTDEVLEVDHDRGTYQTRGHLQLWAIRDLPEPFDTPLPVSKEEAEQPPHASRVYDMDNDGHPGVTIFVEGIVNGEIYGVQRKTLTFRGITRGPDRALGLGQLTKESLQLGASSSLLELGAGKSSMHPNPQESWFDEIRLPDDAGCDDVLAADAEQRLSRLRPF